MRSQTFTCTPWPIVLPRKQRPDDFPLFVTHVTGVKQVFVGQCFSCSTAVASWIGCVNSLIYSAQSRGVHTVFVRGVIVLEDGRSNRVDEKEEFERIDTAARALYRRMG